MTLNDAVNEVLKHAPAFREIKIIPMLLRENDHIVIADGKLIQGTLTKGSIGIDSSNTICLDKYGNKNTNRCT